MRWDGQILWLQRQTPTATHDLGMLPVGISFEFSWILTFCQSENLLCSMANFHPVRAEHVELGQTDGYEKEM